VGPDSDIPNVNGYRTDVLEALKAKTVSGGKVKVTLPAASVVVLEIK
jgi:alpha-L-arabinofuranosidase